MMMIMMMKKKKKKKKTDYVEPFYVIFWTLIFCKSLCFVVCENANGRSD
jgi:hypothetical protein